MTIARTLATTVALTAAGTIATLSIVDAGRGATHASATLVDASGAAVGTVRLVEDADGTLHVNVKAAGLEQGDHGIHFHAVGDCTPTFAAAGGHHNPLGLPHGQHAGDLPNLRVNPAGRGQLTTTTHRATLDAGPLSVLDADGSAVVVHALPDDFQGQPAGNSGDRIACGVISLDP